jgi:hypothetical protein
MATPTTLPASFVAGDILTAAQMNALRGAFRVLQVVQATQSTAVTTTSVSFVTSNLSASITPSSTSSLVLAMYTGTYGGSNGTAETYTALFRGTVAGSNLSTTANYANSTPYYSTSSKIYLDNPATTSALTYTIGFRTGSGATTATAQVVNQMSTLILMEISA